MVLRRSFLRPSSRSRAELPFKLIIVKPRGQKAVDVTGLQAADRSILSIFNSRRTETGNTTTSHLVPNAISVDLTWYLAWIEEQLDVLPNCLIELVSVGEEKKVTLRPESTLFKIFMAVNDSLRQIHGGVSIDDIITCLGDADILPTAKNNEELQAHRLLIFTILGWQSMLYLPSFNTCPLEELAIHQDIDQPHSVVFQCYKAPADLADRPMSILLKAYGDLLPSRQSESWHGTNEGTDAVKSNIALVPRDVNAYLIHTLLRVEFRWVDTLAHHLDYDKSTRTLSLFRHPSFCLAMLESGGALFSFASVEQCPLDPRADTEDIRSILVEILLSYRLLFGQSRKSRHFFRHLLRSDPALSNNPDSLLSSLCTKRLFTRQGVPRDRLNYLSDSHFPTLEARVKVLVAELKGARPTGWRDLFRDRRDKVQYWTFWLVAFIGAVGILLAIAQVALQAVQIANL